MSYRRYSGYYGSSDAGSSYGSSYGSTGRGLYGTNYSTPRYGTSSYNPRSTSVDRSSSKDRGHYGSSDYSYRSLGNLPTYSSNTRKSYGYERTPGSGSISDYSSWDRGSRYGSSTAQDSSKYYTPRARKEYPSYTPSTYSDSTSFGRSRSMDARSSYNRQISHESVHSEHNSYTRRNSVISTPKCKDYPQPPYDQPWSCSESDSVEEQQPPDLDNIRKEGRFVTSRGTSPPPNADDPSRRKSRRSISRRKRQFFPKEKVRIEIDGRVLIGEAAPMPTMNVRVQTSPVREEHREDKVGSSSARGSGYNVSDTYLKYRYSIRQGTYSQSSYTDRTPSRSSYRSDKNDVSEKILSTRDRDANAEAGGSWRNKVYGEEKRRSPSPEPGNRSSGTRRRIDSDYQARGRRRQGVEEPSDSCSHGTDQTSMKESIEKVRSWRKYLDTSLDDSTSVTSANQRISEEQLSPASGSSRPSDGSRTRSQRTRGSRDCDSPDPIASTPHRQQHFFSTENEFVKDIEDKSFRKSKLNMSDDVFTSDPPTSPRPSVSDKASVKQSQYSPRSRVQSRHAVQKDGHSDITERQESTDAEEKLHSSESRTDAKFSNAISDSAYTSRCRDIDDLLADTKFSDDELKTVKPALPSDVQMLLVRKSWSKLNIVDLIGICHKQRPQESTTPHMFKGYRNIDELLENCEVDVGKLEDCALQLYRYNGSEGEYGSYLDLDYSLNEQWEELEGFNDERRNVIILRTKLTVRVLACIEKLISSSGRELRRSLFSLKPIFQDDKDLVHEFVNHGGLECLIKIGEKSDHNHQNYILRALGQVMLYVDGMQGIIARNVTIQWLYSLMASKFRGVAKAAVKLLLVFLNYGDSNEESQFRLISQAVATVHQQMGTKPWSYLINILKEQDGADVELQKIAMTFINQLLASVPDQDTFYDITDALEELGMEGICDYHLSKRGADLDLTQQVYLYSMALKVEDGDEESVEGQVRRPAKARSEIEHRKSRRSMDHGKGAQRSDSPLAAKESPESASTRETSEASTSETDSARERTKNSTPTQDTPVRSSNDQNGSNKEVPDVFIGTTDYVEISKEDTPSSDHPFNADVTDHTSGETLDTISERDAVESNEVVEKGPPKENIAARFERMERMRSPSVEKTPIDDVAVEGSVKFMHDKLTNADVSTKESCAKGPVGDISGLIMKAKDELTSASFSKAEKNQQISDAKPAHRKTEDDMQWDVFKENLLNGKVTLRIGDFDFTDLHDEEDENCLEPKPSVSAFSSGGSGVPPPPTLPNWMPPPPPPPPIPPGPLGIPSPPPPPPPPNSQSSKNMDVVDGLPPPAGADAVKYKKTVRLHWKEINPNRVLPVVKETIWSQIVDVDLDYERLQHLFESRTTETRLKDTKVSETKKEIVVLNTKRSNAINIGMTVLPPPRTIKAAILKMDTSIISREGIEKILTMIPTEEERNLIMEAQVSNPDTPLGPAEQFLLTLSSVTELEARLQLWAFKLDYELNEKEMLEHLMDLKSGIESIYTNKTFIRILSVLLGVGNYLNGTRSRGFTIDYLSKVPEVRDTVHKHSLLHHLVAIVHEQFPDTSDLYSDIGAVTRSSKVDWDELSEKLNHMENDCKKSFLHLRAISKHDSNSSTKAILTEFLQDCRKRIMLLRVIHTRVLNRFRNLLLFLGMPLSMAKDVKVNTFCKSLSEFALEYRTTREKIITQIQKRQNNRERKKTRGKMIYEPNDSPDSSVVRNAAPALLPNPPRRLSPSSAASSAVSDDDDRLQAVLYHDRGGGESSRESVYGSLGRKRLSTGLTTQRPSSGHYNSSQATDSDVRGDETGEDQDELLEACVKTASSSSTRRVKEKRRARNTQRKSLRRTLKSGLKDDEIQVIAEYV